jgi:hypothetical protein
MRPGGRAGPFCAGDDKGIFLSIPIPIPIPIPTLSPRRRTNSVFGNAAEAGGGAEGGCLDSIRLAPHSAQGDRVVSGWGFGDELACARVDRRGRLSLREHRWTGEDARRSTGIRKNDRRKR